MGRWPKLFRLVAPIWGTFGLWFIWKIYRYIGNKKKVPKQKTRQILRKRVICDYLLLNCITGKKFEILNSTITIKGLKETTHGYKKERNKANDFTCKLQYDVSIFSNRRQSDFTKCSLMISQREIMISRLV